MTTHEYLLPVPREVRPHAGSFSLERQVLIVCKAELLFEAQWIQSVFDEKCVATQIVTTNPTDAPALVLEVDSEEHTREAYSLNIENNRILIRGGRAGVFYGLCTLRQMLMQAGAELSGVAIKDHPDFPARGVMLDISRDKVYTMETLYMLVDDLAALKVNQLQLYIEHTFAYQDHERVWQHASPMTAQEIMELDAYCKQRHIDLVPNQNSLGHMERWLLYDRYKPLAETPDGFTPSWGGGWRAPSTIDPADPRSLELIAELYTEYLPNFSSSMFNVGCDEPWELGKGKSKAAVEERGGRVYLEWVQKLHKLVSGHGRQMQFWGDIIIKHPDLVPEIPENVITLEWGYDETHPFDEHGAIFAQSGVPYYVCPGTSSWNSLIGRTDNAIGNLKNAAENGLKHGAIGYLNTDWGDRGHWQQLPVSFLGFAVGAALSWCHAANKDLDVQAAMDRFVWQDSAGVMGKLAYDLGNIYKIIGPDGINGQILAYALAWDKQGFDESLEFWNGRGRGKPDLSPQTIRKVIARIDEILEPMRHVNMKRKDAGLVMAEFIQGARLAQHSAKWLLYALGHDDNDAAVLYEELETLLMGQRTCWLARNRRGGLDDSMRRFDALRKEYVTASGRPERPGA